MYRALKAKKVKKNIESHIYQKTNQSSFVFDSVALFHAYNKLLLNQYAQDKFWLELFLVQVLHYNL